MRSFLPSLLFLLTATFPAFAGAVSDAADEVAAAHATGDQQVLVRIADGRKPDPWRVADELCRREKFDAAAALASAGSGWDTRRLADYVAGQRQRPWNAAVSAAFEKGMAALKKRDWKAVLPAVESVEMQSGDVVSIRAGHLRAVALKNLHQFEECEDAYSAVADAAAKIGWEFQVRRALYDASASAFRRGAFERSLSFVSREEKVARAAGDQRAVCGTLARAGLLLINLAEYERAAETIERNLALARKIGDDGALCRALNNRGIMNRRRGRLRDALEAYEQALVAAERSGSDSARAQSLGNVALVRSDLGENEAALEAHRAALAIYKGLGRPDDVARLHGNIGIVLKNLGNYEAALVAQTKSLEIYRQTGSRRGIVRAMGNLGVVHKRRGDLVRAAELQLETLRLSRRYGIRSGALGALVNLGVVYKNLAEYSRALECYREARTMAADMGLKPDEAGCLLNEGLVHQSLGDYGKALDLLEEALEQYQEIDEGNGIASCLINLANTLRDVGDPKQARAYLEMARTISVKQKDLSAEASAIAGLANLDMGCGETTRAIDRYRRVLEIRTKIGETHGVAEAHASLGNVLGYLGNEQVALVHLRKASSLAETAGARQLMFHVQHQLGRAHLRSGRLEEARAHFNRALSKSGEYGAQSSEASALGGLAAVAIRSEQYAEAIAHTNRAIGILSLLVTGLADEQGAYVRSEYATVFDNGVRAALGTGSTSEVFRLLEAGRAGILLQSIGGRDRLRTAVLPKKLVDKEARARSAEAVALDRLRHALDTGKRADVRARRAELDAARVGVRSSVETIQREARRQAGLLYPKPADLEEVQDSLSPQEALVEYSLTNARSVALVVTKQDARVVDMASPGRIEAAVFDADAPGQDPARAIARLRKLVIDPLALPATIRRLIVSPAGALSYAPFCLLAPKREIAFVPSGTARATLLGDAKTVGSGVLALADPEFGKAGNGLLARRSAGRLTALPSARSEARHIGDTLLIGANATRSGLRTAIAGRPRWRAIHLACHGFVDPEDPARAWLALVGESGGVDDLTCLDIYRMTIPADLVVLSACETAKGKLYKAEGVVGFTSAFLFAGAPRVLVSLWKVDDEATKALMVKFYELWNRKDGKRMPAATALWRAQEHVRSQDRWKHPYYWAAWMLWGLAD